MRRPTHILLDFFGTLVDYSASRTAQGYRRTYTKLLTFGLDLSYEDFLAGWSRTCEEFDRRSDVDDHEFSMTAVGAGYLRSRLAVVSNTHDPLLVPGHLETMGVLPLVDAVVLSVDVG